MKRFISAVLLAAMLGSVLVACNSTKKANEATTEAEDQIQETTPVEIEASEYVKLGEYKNIKIEEKKAEVTEQDIDNEIEGIRQQYAEYKKINKKVVEADDIVNIDYVCYVDGEEVDSYSGEDYDLVLGNGDFTYSSTLDIDGTIVGKKVGDTYTIEGKFDSDDYNEEVAGKDGKFEVTVNYIAKESLPEITKEFVKENFEYNSVAEYRESVRQELLESAQSDAETENRQAAWEKVVSNCTQIKEFPQDKIDLEKQNILIDESEWASYYGAEIGETEEEQNQYFKETYNTTLEEYAKDSLLRQCVLQLIIKEEKIEATEEEISALVKEEMENGGYSSEKEVYEYASKEDFEEQVIYEKVMALIEGK